MREDFPTASGLAGPDVTLILAAHGSGRNPRGAAIVRGHARRLTSVFGYPAVLTAFHQGSPSFSRVLERVETPRAIVTPFFASQGYYSDQILPKELEKNRRFTKVRLAMTRAVGAHPKLGDIVLGRAREVLDLFHPDRRRCAVLLVGHGTRRNRRSSRAAKALAERLAQQGDFARVLPAFLDEEPGLERVFRALSCKTVLVLPILMGGSQHVEEDIPARLGISRAALKPAPALYRVAGRLVILDRALGFEPRLTGLIADLAAAAYPGIRKAAARRPGS